MSYQIARHTTTFRYGMSDANQLREWLSENKNIIGLSFVGRSNVGKSSLINTLFGKNTARTSKTPGRTREVNIFTFQLETEGKVDISLPNFYLFDLPGYGHASISKEMAKNWDLLMTTFFELAPQSIGMVNLQDARHPHQTSDQKFHEFFERYPFETHLAFNKVDKLKKQKERAALEKIKPQILELYSWVKSIHFVSAEKKSGVSQLEQVLINFLFNQLQKKN